MRGKVEGWCGRVSTGMEGAEKPQQKSTGAGEGEGYAAAASSSHKKKKKSTHRGHNQQAPLRLFNGVDVLLHHSVHETLVKPVHCAHHNVQRGALHWQRPRARYGVQEVKGGAAGLALLLALQRAALGLGKDALAGGPLPGAAG